MLSRISSQRSSQPQLSPEARCCAIRPYAAQAERIAAAAGEGFCVASFKWGQKVGELQVWQLIDLGLAMDAIDPDGKADLDERADSARAKRFKALREVITSQIHHQNSSHLEGVLESLDAATKQLDRTMLLLAVIGLFLTVVQVLQDHNSFPRLNVFPVVGLGMALILAFALHGSASRSRRRVQDLGRARP